MKTVGVLLLVSALAPAMGGAGIASGPVRIAFVSDRASSHTDLYVMNADGSGQHRVTNTPHDALFKAAFEKLQHARGLLRHILPPAFEARARWGTLRIESAIAVLYILRFTNYRLLDNLGS